MKDLASIWAGTQAAISLYGALTGKKEKKGEDSEGGFLSKIKRVPTFGLSQRIGDMGLVKYYPEGERISSSDSAARFGGLRSKTFGTNMEQLYEPRNKTMQTGLNVLADQTLYNALKKNNRLSLGYRFRSPEQDYGASKTIALDSEKV